MKKAGKVAQYGLSALYRFTFRDLNVRRILMIARAAPAASRLLKVATPLATDCLGVGIDMAANGPPRPDSRAPSPTFVGIR